MKPSAPRCRSGKVREQEEDELEAAQRRMNQEAEARKSKEESLATEPDATPSAGDDSRRRELRKQVRPLLEINGPLVVHLSSLWNCNIKP